MNRTDTSTRPKISTGKIFMVAGFGTAMEFYDFTIYGLAAALIFPKLFFPDFDPLVGTIIAFAAFGSGFLARPLGGIVFGHFGDKYSRRTVLITTLIIMGTSTFLIGCLPGYATLGVVAPILLVLLRLLQGFSAGGEWGGASLTGVENAPEHKRGLFGSFTSMGIGLGSLVGSGVFALLTLMPEEQLLAYGWRIAFWIGGALVLVGVIARTRMPQEEPSEHKATGAPLIQALRKHPKQILLAIGVAFGYNTLAYIGSIFTVTYAEQRDYSPTVSMVLQVLGAAVFVIAAPLMASLSDKYGRKRVVGWGTALYAGFFFLFFPMVDGHVVWMVVLAYALINIFMAAPQGCIPAFLSEQFPRETRMSAISATYQTGAALGGGTAATVAAALFAAFGGNPIGVALYTALASLVLIGCAAGLRETHKVATRNLGTTATPQEAFAN
ncbi:MFS transporter [Glutamicibacter sp. PS]|uniref:MFS transporter n=1 Tax=Glutamicibacter sp. PS TaxID=3075634 RepID=UPI00283CE440|nr:MFS transporter [Glutamicibacter sp. PS]MDR4533979.1 MFS transporter [Glutamicibacter sp. PS]